MLVNLICQVLLEKSITLQTLHLYVQPFWEKEGFSCCWLELFYIFISLTTQWSLFQLKKKQMMWLFLFHFLKTRLVRELEKKFSGKHVVIVARVGV